MKLYLALIKQQRGIKFVTILKNKINKQVYLLKN